MVYSMQQMRELDRAERATEARGEEFDADAFFRKQLHENKMREIIESDDFGGDEDPEAKDEDDSSDTCSETFDDPDDWDDDGFDEDPDRSSDGDEGFEEEPEAEEDSDSGTDGDGVPEDRRAPADHFEDSWAGDDHNQRSRKGGGGSSSNGLRQAEQLYEEASRSFESLPEDGMGLIVPELTAFRNEDEEPKFRRPRSEAEEKEQAIREVEEFVADVSSEDTDWDDGESTAEPRLTDYAEKILAKAERMSDEFFDDDAEERHYQRLREDQHYLGSSDYEIFSLQNELRHKLKFYEDRGEEENIRFVYGAAKAAERARGLFADKARKEKQLREMHENGELTDMEYADNSVALEYRLRKRLTANEYSAISGGSSVGEEIGEVMDEQNNLLDDMDAADPEILQEAREFIGSVPREVAMHYLEEAVEDGLITREQKNHLMTMAARPSLSRPPKPRKKTFADNVRQFFKL